MMGFARGVLPILRTQRLRVRFLDPGGLHHVPGPRLPPLAGVVKLPAFSRAIERRHAAMDDRFRALDAAARRALLCAGFHGRSSADRDIADRGAAGRRAAPAAGRLDSGSGEELEAAHKGHRIYANATHRRHADGSPYRRPPPSGNRLKTLLSCHFHRLFYLSACFVHRRLTPLITRPSHGESETPGGTAPLPHFPTPAVSSPAVSRPAPRGLRRPPGPAACAGYRR
jgi:hypothetical protein